MTVHNLGANLSWLLQQRPCLRLPLEYSTIPEPSSEQVYQTPEEEAEEVFLEAPTRQASIDSPQGIDETGYMARLQLAPQATPKPSLFIQHKTPNPVPSPAASRSTLEPPSSRRNAPAVPLSVSRQQSAPKTPSTNYDDSVFDGLESEVFDIDDMEFAGADFTTSSFGSLGPPKILWTEDAASRVDPLPCKKGKKRKSEEYQEDRVCPRQSQRETKRPSYAIPQHKASPLAGYSSQQTVKAKSPKQGEWTGQQPTSGRLSASPGEAVDFDEELSITKTTIRTETRRSRSSAQLQRPRLQEFTPPRQYATQPNISPKRPIVGNSRGKTPKHVVEDSEDEDDAPSIQVKHETSPLRNMSFPLDHIEEEEFKVASSSPTKPAIINSGPETASSHTKRALRREFLGDEPPTTSEKMSPSKPTKLQPRSSQSVPVTPAEKLTDTAKAYVKKFMSVNPERCNNLIEDLQRKKARANSEMVIAMMEDDDEKAAFEIQKKKNFIASRITAVESLMMARNSYSKLLTRKEEVKERMHQLLEDGEDLDPSDPDKELTKLYKSIKEMKTIVESEESSIYELLQKAGLDDDAQLADRSTFSVPTGRILVGSTQNNADVPLQEVEPVTTQTKDAQPSQRVAQTPVPSKHHHQSALTRPADRAAGNTASSSQLHRADNDYKPQRSPTRRDNPHKQANDFAVVRPVPKDFTRTMGSPAPDFSVADDFDMDDADMLDAAEAFEQDWAAAGSSKISIGDSRHALAEISDNVRRDAPKADMYSMSTSKAALKQYQWSKEVKEAMRRVFLLKGFRHNQLEAINATLEGKDAFVLMPTGGGKSLCYQLPSIVRSGKTQGVTIVISPLISLMQDQVAHLQKLKIQAFLVNSECTAEHRKMVFQALSDHNVQDFIQLLYVTPEMLSKSQAMISKFQDLHRRNKLARIVIDEAHCVSQWGHDFRPDYKALGEWRRNFPHVPVMALTATATENVKYDVIHNLGMDGCDVFTQSFNRPNLTYTIMPKSKGNKVLEDIAGKIKTLYKGQCGIVYCLSRATCEKIAQKLKNEHGIMAMHYHAGMESQERAEVQKEWQAGKYHVIVATIAFGMGIDKPDVRYVIHHSIPKSLEGYYQETGRAGRDGKRSGCYLYYGYGDTSSLKRMINDGEGNYQQKERQKAMLRQVVQFCENQSDCRRVQILGYFNERFEREECRDSCDNCQSDSTFETRDFTKYARGSIQLVRRVHKDQVTLIHCADVLAGRKIKKASELGHDELEEFGMGSDIDRGDVERIFQRLLSEDALEEYNVMNGMGFPTAYIKLGPNFKDFESGRKPLKIQVRVKSPNGKSKGKEKAAEETDRKKRTGEDYPASTNISSPMQARSRGKLTRGMRPETHQIEEESDIDYFEPVREKGILQRSKTRELGPPITIDEKMETLNATHRHIVDIFVETAKKALQKIMFSKSLRRQPITDTQLREIAVAFPQNSQELLIIEGVDEYKVKTYGRLLLKLVKEAHNDYEAMMRAQEDRPDDPNHKNVVEISSDEEDFVDDEEDFDMSQSEVDFDDTETSQYFSAPDPDGKRFNAQSEITASACWPVPY